MGDLEREKAMVAIDALKPFCSMDVLSDDREMELCNERRFVLEAEFSFKRQQLLRNKQQKFIFYVIYRLLMSLVVVICCAFNPFHTESAIEVLPQEFLESN